ncbi:hypothetical protein BCR44DRAFT_1449553, partial [Catenaria anguillulae PL171]
MTKVATKTQPCLSHARPNHPPPALFYPRAGQRPSTPKAEVENQNCTASMHTRAIHQCMPPEQMVHCLVYPRAGQRADNLLGSRASERSSSARTTATHGANRAD